MAEKAYNVGIYCRLSNDDERDGESVSIENQENICQGGFHLKDKIPLQIRNCQFPFRFGNIFFNQWTHTILVL